MGTFMGHAMPGTFFTLFGGWWAVQIIIRNLHAKVHAIPFKSHASFQCRCLPNFPTEGFLKIVASTIGIIAEIVTAFRDGEFANIGNGQHIVMYSFATISGIVDIVIHCRPMLLPVNADYLALCLASLVEALLFSMHLHGRSNMDVQLHYLFVFLIVATVVFTWYEMVRRNSVLVALSRAYFTILQGTWMWQIGAILYPPVSTSTSWDQTSHSEMMITAMIFACHLGIVFILLLIIYAMLSRFVYDQRLEEEIALAKQDAIILHKGMLTTNPALRTASLHHLLESDSEVDDLSLFNNMTTTKPFDDEP